MHEIEVLRIGLQDYTAVWQLQKDLQTRLIDGDSSNYLIVCQHFPCITIGRSSKDLDLIANREDLALKNVSLHKIERGGEITYHGPEQIIAYPILRLKYWKEDVHWYMRTLEEVVMQTLNEFEISSNRVVGRTGVWTENSENVNDFAGKKIASIGVRISRWCSMHGLALNVHRDQGGFSLINPCGFPSGIMTSMEEQCTAKLNLADVSEILIEKFLNVLQGREKETSIDKGNWLHGLITN